ncbi:MAG: type II toxin-antitoxin system VapC family toxin [Verrucomicrobia bacterium]|nr:type II toxin-antitoxin system VapC family toxin [Verrucomicrobiota bacterium]
MAGGVSVIVLDTCALLWLTSGSRKLTQNARTAIADASVVYLSSITAFEIGVKARKGVLSLPFPATEWIASVLSLHDLSEIPLTAEICGAACDLPPIHKDPFDRFIIATAKKHGLPVVTADKIFSQYNIEVIW